MNIKKRGQELNIDDVIKRTTGYLDLNQFLNGSRHDYKIKYIDELANKVNEFIKKKKPIVIVGDYDVDGVTASAIMYMTLKKLGANVKVRLPRRLSEGFGLSEKIVDEINEGLILTVDNGIVAIDAVKKAKDKGLEVIITDHHLPSESGILPPADIIIDPHIEGTADFADYCGAGIAYKIACELTTDEKFLAKMSCFAALGTVSDVMKLNEDNRLIVIEGLKNMTINGNRTTGLYAMLKKNYVDEFITTTDIGFKIGPMINAAGRLYDKGAIQPLTLLVQDGEYKPDMADKLFDINGIRKKLVEEALPKFEKQISENNMKNDFPLVIYEPEIPEGLIGIIAGKLAEKYDTPVFAFSDSENPDIIKGSARTARQVHLKELLDKSPEQFYKYGGHAEAAGISIIKSNFDNAKRHLQKNCIEPLGYVKDDTLYYDLEIDIKDLPKVYDELEKYEPFGEGNPKVVFKIKNFEITPTPFEETGIKYMGANKNYVKFFGNNVSAFGDTSLYLESIADQLYFEISKFSTNTTFTTQQKDMIGYAISYLTHFNMDNKENINKLFDMMPTSDEFKRYCKIQFELVSENNIYKEMYSFKNVLKALTPAKKIDMIGTLSINYFKGDKNLQIDILGIQDPNRILEINKENIIKNNLDEIYR